jgi:hypothetical protein
VAVKGKSNSAPAHQIGHQFGKIECLGSCRSGMLLEAGWATGVRAMQELPRHQQNASGDFYVWDQQCTACEASPRAAPDLMSQDETYGHCFFHRQPTTPEELEQAISAVYVSCVRAVRYGGTDPTTLKRLSDLGSSDSCDCTSAKPSVPNSRQTIWGSILFWALIIAGILLAVGSVMFAM